MSLQYLKHSTGDTVDQQQLIATRKYKGVYKKVTRTVPHTGSNYGKQQELPHSNSQVMAEPYGFRTEHRSYICLLTFHEYFYVLIESQYFYGCQVQCYQEISAKKKACGHWSFLGYCVNVLYLAVNFRQLYALAILLTLLFNTSTRVSKKLDVFHVAYLNLSVSKTNITALGKYLLHNYYLYSKNFFPIRKQTSLFVQLQLFYPV